MATIYLSPSKNISANEKLAIKISNIGWTDSLDSSSEHYTVTVYFDNSKYNQWKISYGTSSFSKIITAPSYQCTISIQVKRHVAGVGEMSDSSAEIDVIASSSGDSGGSGTVEVASPTIGTLTLTPINPNGSSIAVQGVSKIQAQVSGCYANYGSIKQYIFSGQNLSSYVHTSNAYASATSDTLTSYGTLTYTASVVNTGGGVSSKSTTIYCHPYSAPSFVALKAYRSDSDKTPKITGDYITYEYQIQYSYVNNTNVPKIILYLDGSKQHTITSVSKATLIDSTAKIYRASGSYIHSIGTTSSDKQYKVYATISDTYNTNAIKSETVTIYSSTKILSIAPGGQSMSIGGSAPEVAAKLECKWDADFMKSVNVTESLQSKSLTVSNTATFTKKPTWNGWTAPEVLTGTFKTSGTSGTHTINFNKTFSITPTVVWSHSYDYNGTPELYLSEVSTSTCKISYNKVGSTLTVYWLAVNAT